MTLARLIRRNLTFYYRTNLAVVAGVAIAVAVLAGALIVGSSVRASLRKLALGRLGEVEAVVSAQMPFRAQLAKALGGVPVLALEGVVTHQASGKRANRVQVYAFDEGYFDFQKLPHHRLVDRDIYLSPALNAEIAPRPNDTFLVKVEKLSEVPRESLHGRREDSTQTLRFRFAGPLPEFSLIPQQGDIRAVYVPIARFEDRANNVLIKGRKRDEIEKVLRQNFTIEDLALRVRVLEKQKQEQLESPAGLLPDKVISAAGAGARIFTYLANSIRSGDKVVPYSLVSGFDLPQHGGDANAIVLNDWAAKELGAQTGETIELEYFLWKTEGQLETASAKFKLTGIVSVDGPLGDPDFAPKYPGITESGSLSDWDPPFPFELSRIRKQDEQYWERYRTTPKAFIPVATASSLWGSRFGSLTSVRFPAGAGTEAKLKATLDPLKNGFSITEVREQALAASSGSTDFGEYFLYFSYFLVMSALLLAALFFRLGIEQRTREIGVLESIGFDRTTLRKVFLIEGAVLSVVGAVMGAGLALGYAALVIHGLKTWWLDAVGTTAIELSADAMMLMAGAVGGVLAALITIVLALRELNQITPKGLVMGSSRPLTAKRRRVLRASMIACAAGAMVLLALLPRTGGFFGGSALLLIAALIGFRLRLSPLNSQLVKGLVPMGVRSAESRPGRSILSIALIAFASFLLVSIDSFRRGADSKAEGGFRIFAESQMPIYHDLNRADGRAAYGLNLPEGTQVWGLRLKPGDDASCLNLYQPENPRIAGVPDALLRAKSIRGAEALLTPQNDGAIAAVVDMNSLTYVLHKKVGDVIESGGARLRIVGALSDSVFQSEVLIAESSFVKAFPQQQGYRLFLINGPDSVIANMEEALSDFGFDAMTSEAKLATFHRVENTYLSTFQALGALGLMLGTLGLAVVLIRNVLERQRELALLRAVGFAPMDLVKIIVSENLYLLSAGAISGLVCALIAVAPALMERGSIAPALRLAAIPMVVVMTGLTASLAAAWAAMRLPLIQSLRSE